MPPVPEGSALRFTLSYVTKTCRVAFYSPTAVAAGGFVEPPYATLEMRFTTPIPEGVTLYPAMLLLRRGVEVRLM
jgi:hypothetical protein